MTVKTVTSAVKQADPRRISFIASHQKTDRDSEVIVVSGIDRTDFERNPLLLLQHNRQDGAVARVEHLRVTSIDGAPALIGEAVFPDRPRSQEVLADVRAGLLNSVSIGFVVEAMGPPMLPGQQGATFLKTKLLEISLVSIPACPTCLVTSKSCRCAGGDVFAGIDMAELVRTLRAGEHERAVLSRLTPTRLTDSVTAGVRVGLREMITTAVEKEIRYLRGRVD